MSRTLKKILLAMTVPGLLLGLLLTTSLSREPDTLGAQTGTPDTSQLKDMDVSGSSNRTQAPAVPLERKDWSLNYFAEPLDSIPEGVEFSPAPARLPFGVGERLRYHMDFSFVRAGYSEMSILSVDSSTLVPSYHFRSRVRSTSTIDWVYKVRDVVEAWFAMDGLYSTRYERNVHEGSYHSVKFCDYNNNTAWVSLSNEYGPKGMSEFEPFSHNIISGLYWVRCQPLAAGVDLHLPVHDIEKQYPLKIVVYGREEVEVPAGTFTCWKIEPIVESEGLFKAKGRLWIWLTDDENRLPVLMKSEIPVGTVDGKLATYRLGDPWTPDLMIPDDGSDSKWDW